MFAEDLNVFQQFKKKTPVQECKDAMARCKETVHKWGTRNRVTFDAGKEHAIIIHPSDSHVIRSNCWDAPWMSIFVCTPPWNKS